MYDVTRKGQIHVYRIEGLTETLVSSHVDETKAVQAACNDGEQRGGGNYRLSFPDKMVRVIIQGPSPTAPIIAATPVTGSTTELDIALSVPALGVAPPMTYQLEESTTGSGGPFAVVPSSFTGTPLRTRRSGLTAGAVYHYRARAFDSAAPQRVSAYSNVANATVNLPAPASSWWPNWPTMQVLILQGNANFHLLDPTQYDKIADHEAYVFQGFNPTLSRVANRVTRLGQIRAQQNPAKITTKFLPYTSFQQTVKDVNNDGDTRPIIDLINSPTEGNPNWWLRRVNGAQIEAPFDPADYWMVNGARSGLLNSLGETYQKARWRKLLTLHDPSDAAHDLVALLSGYFQDDVHARMQTPMTINNGAQTVTDPDFEQNGVAENITDFGVSATAGCRKWCEGHLDSQTELEAQKPGFLWFPNCARHSTQYYDGGSSPPLPLSGHPYYGKLAMGVQESIDNSGLGLANNATNTGYVYNGGGSLFHASRLLAIQQKMLRPDAQSPTGRSCTVVHVNLLDRTPVDDDYEHARLILVLALLNERCAASIQMFTTRPLSLDEALIELGNPLGPRSLGTLNETNVAFTQRAPDATVSGRQFFWMEFEKGWVGLCGSSPTVGPWPDPNETPVNCPLPNPGAGMKWQFLGPSYTNPKTDRVTRNQQPSLNTGLDCGPSIPFKRYQARVIRRVPA